MKIQLALGGLRLPSGNKPLLGIRESILLRAAWTQASKGVWVFYSSVPMPPLEGELPANDSHQSDWTKTLALLVITLTCLYLACAVLLPFLSSLVWAIALAVIVHPAFRRLEVLLNRESLAASLIVALLGVFILFPCAWVSRELILAAIQGLHSIIPTTARDVWLKLITSYPALDSFWNTLEGYFHISLVFKDFVSSLGAQTTHIIRTSMWGFAQVFLILFFVFFLLRDSHNFLRTLEDSIPLSAERTNRIIHKVHDTIHATLFGMVAVAALQGLLGGLLLWWLELPGAAIWGTIMALLALVPYLGAFIVWIPVAVFLLLKGDIASAIVTILWGTIVVGFSDNLLYPILVGKRMHYHSLVVFLFLLGGFFIFGAAGVVLGPVVLALTDGLISEWRDRSQAARAV